MKRLLGFIPVLLVMHNIEEALTMPQWISVHLDMLRVNYPLFENFRFSTTQIYLSLLQISIIPMVISILCVRGEVTKWSVMVLMTLQSIVFLNAFIPHLAGTLILRMYNPGTVTAVVCNIPFSIFLASRLVRDGIVGWNTVRQAMAAGVLLYLPVVYLNHLLAHTLSDLIFH